MSGTISKPTEPNSCVHSLAGEFMKGALIWGGAPPHDLLGDFIHDTQCFRDPDSPLGSKSSAFGYAFEYIKGSLIVRSDEDSLEVEGFGRPEVLCRLPPCKEFVFWMYRPDCMLFHAKTSGNLAEMIAQTRLIQQAIFCASENHGQREFYEWRDARRNEWLEKRRRQTAGLLVYIR